MAISQQILALSFGQIALLALLCFLLHLVANRLRPGLHSIPGPLCASLTDIWRLVSVARGHHQDTIIELHRRYGSKLIRIGPNTVSVVDPEAVKVIYGLNNGFTKV